MSVEYKDFIGVFSDVFPEGFCPHVIKEFERHKEMGVGSDRQKNEGVDRHIKNDYQIFSNGNNIDFNPFEKEPLRDLFFKGLQHCFEKYSNEFSVIKDVRVVCNNMKIQKTCTGGGYHVWHHEQGNNGQANRGLVYMLYLNTLPLEANGETEFLYQQRRINPVENTMVFWPASFTHAHRGNPVYGNNAKYIVTGWFYYE